MALLSAATKMFTRRPGAAFVAGVLVGMFIAYIHRALLLRFAMHQHTRAPRSLLSLPEQGVSHAPDLLKRVLAARGELPHVPQVAIAALQPGQVASQNWHRDMVGMFVFLRGRGVLQLDGSNYSVGKDTFATVYPPAKHTIINEPDADEPLTLLTIGVLL